MSLYYKSKPIREKSIKSDLVKIKNLTVTLFDRLVQVKHQVKSKLPKLSHQSG